MFSELVVFLKFPVYGNAFSLTIDSSSSFQDLSSTVPSMAYSRVPSLGLVLYLLKNSAADFFRFHQSHRQSLGKLQSLDQLPPEELKEVIDRCNSVYRDITSPPSVYQINLHILHTFWLLALFPVSSNHLFSVVVPRPGFRPRSSGENLISAEELAGQETTGPAHQQQSQAAGLVLLYPLPLADTFVEMGLTRLNQEW